MADSPIPISATIREAVEQTGHIERMAGHLEGEAAQRQRWFRDPKWLTLVLAVIVALGGPSAGILYNTISYYQEAKNHSDSIDQKMTTMQAELSILAAMKPQIDTVARDETRLEGVVAIAREESAKRLDAIEKDRASIREQILQRLSVQETRTEVLLSAVRDLTGELHRLNERHSSIFTPPREFSSEAPASFAPTAP